MTSWDPLTGSMCSRPSRSLIVATHFDVAEPMPTFRRINGCEGAGAVLYGRPRCAPRRWVRPTQGGRPGRGGRTSHE